MDRFKDVYIAILTASLVEEKIDIAELGADALIAKGPFSEMSQHILDVINHPDLASSRCRSGVMIGIENRSSRGMTTELFSVNRSLNDVLQGIREGILEIAPDGRVVFANQAILSIIGEAEERVLGSPLTSLFGENNRQRIEELMKGSGGTLVETEEDIHLIAAGRRLDIYIAIGKCGGNFIVVVRDVTEECEAMEAQETSHAQMKEMIAKNTDAMVIVNLYGRVIFANPAAEILLQGGSDGLTGTDFGFPMATDQSIELDLMGPGKELLVAEMRVAEMVWLGEKVYLASLRDITERKQMEESLKSANQMILEQQKAVIEEERLKVLLQMAGATAHELSQPLNILLGNIELLAMDSEVVPETVSRRIANIVESGKRISGVVRKMQNMRRYETKPYAGGAAIIDFHQKATLLLVEESDRDYETIHAIFKDEEDIHLMWARSTAEAFEILDRDKIDLILMGYFLADGNALGFIEAMNERSMEHAYPVYSQNGFCYNNRIRTTPYDYMNEDRHRCLNPAGVALYPKLCQTSSSSSQTRKPALLTFTTRDSLSLPASYAAVVNNTKAMQDHHTPSPAAPLSIVAATANETPASLQGRSCIGAGSRFTPGFWQPFS